MELTLIQSQMQTHTHKQAHIINPVSEGGLKKQHARWFMNTLSSSQHKWGLIFYEGAKVMGSNKYAHMCNLCRIIGTGRPH